MPGLFKALAWALAVLGLVLFALYETTFDVWTIPTDDPMLDSSLRPTLEGGDVVVISRHGLGYRGAVVRCPDPQAPGRYVVARAFGLPGDQLAIEGELVSIDGHRTPSPRACDPPKVTVPDPDSSGDAELSCSEEEYAGVLFSALRDSAHAEPPTRATVEPRTWFLVSDNRHIHVDSRDFGPIDPAGCQRVVFRLTGPAGVFEVSKRLTFVW